MLSLLFIAFAFSIDFVYAGASYKLIKKLNGGQIKEGFDYDTSPDPYGGAVNYRKSDEFTGLENEFLSTSTETEIEFFRLESKDSFSNGLFIMDVQHIPYGCGAMPYFAIMENGDTSGRKKWGIVECVNKAETPRSSVAYDSSSTCQLTAQNGFDQKSFHPISDMSTNPPTQDTSKMINSVALSNGFSGETFNRNGGGYYIGEWNPDVGFKVWVISQGDFKNENKSAFIESFKNESSIITTDLLKDIPPHAFFKFTSNGGECLKEGKIKIGISLCGNNKWVQSNWNSPNSQCKMDNKDYSSDACLNQLQSEDGRFTDVVKGRWKIRSIAYYEKHLEYETIDDSVERKG